MSQGGIVEALERALKIVRDRYTAETRSPRGKQIRREGGAFLSSVGAIEGDIKSWVHGIADLRKFDYRTRASAGQPNRSYNLVPYITVMRADVTTSPTSGVYVVFLFHEQMSRLYLSLTQGVTVYQRLFPSDADQRLKAAAALLAEMLPAPPGFVPGPIDLGASSAYGKNYQAASIYAKGYELSKLNYDMALEISQDLVSVLSTYEMVNQPIGKNPSIVLRVDVDDDEQCYQEDALRAASELGDTSAKPDVKTPPRTKVKGKAGKDVVPRDAWVAGEAIAQARFKCEIDPTHETFVARSSGKPYVEAHHIVPFSRQTDFKEASLDVPANVAALCAQCHTKIHRAVEQASEPLIERLFKLREQRLKSVGIEIELKTLKRLYGFSRLHDRGD